MFKTDEPGEPAAASNNYYTDGSVSRFGGEKL